MSDSSTTPHSSEEKQLPSLFSLFGSSLTLYIRNFQLFFGFSAWLLVPLIFSIFAYAAFSGDTAEVVNIFFNIILYSFLTVWLSVVIILLVNGLDGKEPFDTKRIGTEAWKLFIPYLIVSLVVSLINIAGFFLLVIPGLIFMTWFVFAPIIAVLEKRSLSEALRRSKELSKHRFWVVFWRVVGGVVLFLLLYSVLLLGIQLTSLLFSGGDFMNVLLNPPEPDMIDETLFRFIEILVFPVFYIYQVLLYLRLNETEKPLKTA